MHVVGSSESHPGTIQTGRLPGGFTSLRFPAEVPGRGRGPLPWIATGRETRSHYIDHQNLADSGGFPCNKQPKCSECPCNKPRIVEETLLLGP